MNQEILSGVRVLDVASYIAAPVATTAMADFGADVIKIEPPRGDAYRDINANPGMAEQNLDFHWQAANRSKRGIALDLTSDSGREVLHRLVAGADVLVTNFPQPTRDRLLLNWADLEPLNERLIYASLSAYGETGPEAANPGFDSTAYWARSGLMHMVRPDPHGDPARSMPGQGDHPSGLALFGAIVLALLDRQRTGRGTHVHTSLLANGLWANAYAAQAVLSGTYVPARPLRHEMPNALTNHYQTRDERWFILTVLNQPRDWPRLLDAVRARFLGDDERFATQDARNSNARVLCAELDAIFLREPLAHWRKTLTEAGLVIGIVGTNEDIATDAQMRSSGALRATLPEEVGVQWMVDSPLWVEGHNKTPISSAPEVGQHTREVLLESGFDSNTIERLAAAGAFGKQE
jgi:crotonobetainyl-CoA:carnitine CoA-transferase CaiB-like acyl-CoA transferase